MILGALIDLGVPADHLDAELKKLGLGGYRVATEEVRRRGMRATQFRVWLQNNHGEVAGDSGVVELPAGPFPAENVPAHSHSHAHAHGAQPARNLESILALIGNSQLSAGVKETAGRIFQRLGEAEAAVHGVPLATVHFHEVGGVDAIVDIVGTAIALEYLGADTIQASALHLGGGFVRAHHGVLPVPAPATARLLAGIPTYATGVAGELVTPTGAAILGSVCAHFGPLPPMRVERVGYGAGSRDREIPNVVRCFLGTAAPAAVAGPLERELAVVIEANIDDMNPELHAYLAERLFAAGASDVWTVPAQMKKGRWGLTLHVLARPEQADALVALVLQESTTIGLRTYQVEKVVLPRRSLVVSVAGHPVRVKVAGPDGSVWNVAPEYEDCRAAAAATGQPLKEIYAGAHTAARRQLAAEAAGNG